MVLCAGIAVEDFLFKVERFPAPGTKMRASDLVATTGGCAANAAVAVARLGGRARFSGPVGTDDASRRFLDALAKTGVDPSGVLRVEGGSISVSGIFIDRDGEKMVATLHGKGLDGATPPDAAALVADIDVLLVDNRFPDFVRADLPRRRRARHSGGARRRQGDHGRTIRCSRPPRISSSRRRRCWRPPASPTSARRCSASPPASAASSRSPTARTTCCGSSDGALRRLPVFKVEAVDTLGAGDSFHGGFALALAEGRDEVAAMRFGAAAAALKCTRFGGISGTPRRDEVEALLATGTRLEIE